MLTKFHAPAALAGEHNVQKAMTFAIPDVWLWAYDGDGGRPEGELRQIFYGKAASA
ncbi:hypothetical protein [Marinobacter orientalis]|uniref:Uncharacterized protein n=1 Tax=Marinobacter orientalis TaxID=1928859 RepID=A0A7Y0RFF8_9GAMM|nr:hypothetical protein [Marinobacter orientalis]NMT65250.1 hypothetical protein [Marinobacter orientalis]